MSESSTKQSIRWKSWPLIESTRNNVFVAAVFGLAAVSIYLSTKSVFWVGLSLLVLVVALRAYFLPTRYELDDGGVKIQTLFFTRTKPWSRVRSYYRDKHGVLLSPFPKPTRLENFRGVFLRFAGNKEQVMDFIKSRVDREPT